MAKQKNISSENSNIEINSDELTNKKYASSGSVSLPLTKAAQYVGGNPGTIFTQPMFFSPLHTPQNWQIASKRKEVYQWARFYYENEPKAAAGIDFYAGFPMNGFTLECKDKKVLAFFEHTVEKLNLDYWLRKISHEHFLLGDVFVFTEIECPVCGGVGHLSNGHLCNHPDGTIKRILILNPDFIEVQSTQLADEPTVALIPDDDLKRVVQQQKPKSVYERIPETIKQYVMSGRPIPLSPRCISHIRHKGSPYGTYGESLLRRLFTIIAYKTKLMTANWIMAERHILPVRIAKVGNAERPASEIDIADVQGQLAAVANDPNLTIVTHHAFEMDFIGATGKIHDISNQMEAIGKEMLDGLMLPQSLLNGEMAGYSCHDESTLTLTDSGFKRWNEIDSNDKIACYNPHTGEMEYHNYIEKHVYDFNGEMVQFYTDKIDICVTPNHRMWSAKQDSEVFEFVEAKDVKPKSSFVGSVESFSGNNQDTFAIGDLEIPIYEYCELAGLFVSEGCTSKDKRKKGNRHAFSICQSENCESFEKKSDCLESSKINYWTDNKSFNLWSPNLSDHFHNEYGHGSNNKKLPTWLKNLSSEYLEIVLKSAIIGYGCEHKHNSRKANNYVYCTSSKQLGEDIAEIAFKCGYAVKIINRKNKKIRNKYLNKTGHQIITNCPQYEVQISRGLKVRKPTIYSKSLKYANKEKTYVPYSGKVYCFTVPHGIFVTMRNGKIAIQGNSAAVGVETLIRRLETWRLELSSWVEKNIFLPIAQMQGFVDTQKSKLIGETVWLYPKVKWNDLRLRDNTQYLQSLVQLHDKGLVSTQKLLSEFNIDFDQEVNRLREEQITAGKGGQVVGESPGGGGGLDLGLGGPPGGGLDLGLGGGGGLPPGLAGPPAGGPPGMEAAPPAGGPPAGGPPPATAFTNEDMTKTAQLDPSLGLFDPQKVYKKGKQPKKKKEDLPVDQTQKIFLTKPEQKLFQIIRSLNVPLRLFAQYEQKVPGSQNAYLLDFAFPDIMLNLEADGDFWHTDLESVERDKQRDMKLASIGWRVVRIRESALNTNANLVTQIVINNIRDSIKERKAILSKQASFDDDDNMIYEDGDDVKIAKQNILYYENPEDN